MRRHLPELALIALGIAPLWVGLSDPIFETDPAQYAEVARRIQASGDLVHLQDNFGPFLNKPPVTMWLSALAIRLLGETSVAARLPSLVAALVLLWAVSRIGAALWDRRTGLTAAALLGNSFALLLMVSDPKVDMVVTCMMGLALWAMVEARQRQWMVWPGWAFAGLGLLSKGPIGLAVPVVALLPEALRRRWGGGEGGLLSRVLAFKPGRGLLLVGALMAPWYWAVLQEHGAGGPTFLLWEQSFARLLHRSEYHNATTPLFYLHTALWAFLPFTPILVWEMAKGALRLWRSRRLPPDEARIVWWWLLLPFLAISLAEFRLPQYLFWLAPAAALLSARALCRDGPERSPLPSWLFGLYLALLVAALAAVALVLEFAFPPSSRLLAAAWLAGLAAVSGGLVWVARRWEPPRRLAAYAVASTSGLALFFAGHLHPSLGEYQPESGFGLLVRTEDPHGQDLPYAILGASNSAAYYAGRPARELGLEELAERVKRGEARVAVTDPQYLPALLELGVEAQIISDRSSFAVSRPTGKFLLASTRAQVVGRQVLVRLSARAAPP